MIDWSDTNTHWGEAGHNVHIAENGSFVSDHKHDDGPVD